MRNSQNHSESVCMRLLEFHVVHHCNLTCIGCSHFSPTAPSWMASPAQFRQEVNACAAKLNPVCIHILGGEPLLHSNIAELFPIVRHSFPRATIKVVTNGVLLPHAPLSLFHALTDYRISLAVSVYPSTASRSEEIVRVVERHGLTCEFWVQDTFLDFLDPQGGNDPVEARLHCPMDDACTVRDGRLFPCPVTAWADFGFLNRNENDGIPLSETVDVIRKVLDRKRTTSLCRFCRVTPTRVAHTLGRKSPQGV